MKSITFAVLFVGTSIMASNADSTFSKIIWIITGGLWMIISILITV